MAKKTRGTKLDPEALRRKLELRQGSRTSRISGKRDIRFTSTARAAAQRGRSAFLASGSLDRACCGV